MRCRLENYDSVARILLDGWINDVCSESTKFEYTKTNIVKLLKSNSFYVLMPHADCVIIYSKVNGLVCEGHIHTLKGCRKKIAIKSAIDSFRWISENTNFKYCIAYIPSIYGNVIRFAYNVGMDLINIFKNGYFKNNMTCDLYMFSREL